MNMDEQQHERLTTADMAGATARDDMSATDDMVADGERATRPNDSNMTTSNQARTPLFPADQSQNFRSRWDSIQAGFVDEPRQAVEQADSLIAEVMKTLAGSFAEERSNLESQLDSGDEVSTEDLRVGLQRYRSFFDRLLSV